MPGKTHAECRARVLGIKRRKLAHPVTAGSTVLRALLDSGYDGERLEGLTQADFRDSLIVMLWKATYHLGEPTVRELHEMSDAALVEKAAQHPWPAGDRPVFLAPHAPTHCARGAHCRHARTRTRTRTRLPHVCAPQASHLSERRAFQQLGVGEGGWVGRRG